MSEPNSSSTSTPVAPGSAPRSTASRTPSKINCFGVGDRLDLFGRRIALDPEHLLLERPAVVERQNVELPSKPKAIEPSP
jgi:hypothetical protein